MDNIRFPLYHFSSLQLQMEKLCYLCTTQDSAPLGTGLQKAFSIMHAYTHAQLQYKHAQIIYAYVHYT